MHAENNVTYSNHTMRSNVAWLKMTQHRVVDASSIISKIVIFDMFCQATKSVIRIQDMIMHIVKYLWIDTAGTVSDLIESNNNNV